MTDRDRNGTPGPEAEELGREELGREELGREVIEALDAWTVPDAPAGFADRVVAARLAAPPPAPQPVTITIGSVPAGSAARRRLLPWAIVGAAALAALFLWQLRGSPATGDVSDSAAPLARESIQLGRRGVAVAEAGALLSWSIQGARAQITQRAGDVFYRVERGGQFEVETAHGTVRVTGTCFRVELNAMKKTAWQGAAGVAIGAALVVTVYEGSVLFAGRDGEERRLSAGETLSSRDSGIQPGDVSNGAGPIAATLPAPPHAGASRDDLLRRDAVQRTEIASLRARVRELERDPGPGAGSGGPTEEMSETGGRPWFDPSPEDLARFAAECRVRNDMPPQLIGGKPFDIGALPGARGLTEEERAAVNRVMGALQREFQAELRAIYVELGGDAARAQELSFDAILNELREMSPEGEADGINRLIAQERAGLAVPPSDLSRLPPFERFTRRQAELGDESERRIAEVLGAARSRELRANRGGWGARLESVGCPGEGATEQVTGHDPPAKP